MGTLPSGGQLPTRECLQPLRVNMSCVEPEVITVKVEEDYTNVVNTVLFLMLIVYINSWYCVYMALHLIVQYLMAT